jgi:hypothetical protein
MVKKTLLAPFVHLLLFLIFAAVSLFFLLAYGAVAGAVPGVSVPDYGDVFYRSVWSAFLITMPLSLFMVIFYIRRHRGARFIAGVLTLISSTLLYAALFVGIERMFPYEGIPEDKGPDVPLVEDHFNRFPDGVVYPFEVDSSGNTGLSVVADQGAYPVFSRYEGFILREGDPRMLYSEEEGRSIELVPRNPVVDPLLEQPGLLMKLSGDFESFRLLLSRARDRGMLFLLMLLGAQGWFCVQSWVIVRAGRWPLVNLFLGAGLFLLLVKAHAFMEGTLGLRFFEWLPLELSATAAAAVLLLFISLPLFFWNIFSSGEAAGHE